MRGNRGAYWGKGEKYDKEICFRLGTDNIAVDFDDFILTKNIVLYFFILKL